MEDFSKEEGNNRLAPSSTLACVWLVEKLLNAQAQTVCLLCVVVDDECALVPSSRSVWLEKNGRRCSGDRR